MVTLPTESLRERSIKIDRDFLLSSTIQHFVQQLIEKMYESDGVGIAASQVGKNIRLCIIGKSALQIDYKTRSGNTRFKKANLDPNSDLILVNPIWTKTTIKKDWDNEGCLSVPKTYGKVRRYKNISVKALNKDGQEINFEANNFFARVIQHEIDHLDGVLFIDKAKDIYTVE